MYLCIYVYIGRYVYMYMCIYVYMCICIYVHMYICIYVYMYLCLYVYMYILLNFVRSWGFGIFRVYWVSKSKCIISSNLRAEGS